MSQQWRRTLKSGRSQATLYDETAIGADPVAWLRDQAKAGMILLAHADDGVIWGRGQEKSLQVPAADLLAQARLRRDTLQMARLFDADQEFILWRTSEGAWRGRRLKDGEGAPCEYFDEEQVLWGTDAEASSGGFTRMSEGVQGLRHAPPLVIPSQKWEDGNHPLRLSVRHYLAEDAAGWVRIVSSRLTDLSSEKEKLP